MGIEFRDRHDRKVSQQQWARGLEEAVFEEAEKALDDRIKRVRCPDHGSSPTNIGKVRRSGGIRYKWDACCEQLNAAVDRALA